MSVIFILMISSLILATAFLIAFLWSVKTGQWEDKYTPSVRILLEDQKPDKNKNKNKKELTTTDHKTKENH